MNFLIVGLGSMGKRRVRCLQHLGYTSISGVEPKAERRAEANEKYGIVAYEQIEQINLDNFDAIIVSTAPDLHTDYVKLAIQHQKPVFIEASVILEDVEMIENANVNGTFVAPSCTLRFHPTIKDITQIVRSEKYGRITNFSYHSGQYLPDWHPWEKVSDFYVSNRNTGGGREIVPFELTWLIDTMGWPLDIKGYFGKTIDVGADLEDSYAIVLKYKNAVGTLLVDVASRYAVRNLIINLEKGQIQWKWDEPFLKLFDRENNRWIKYEQPTTVAAAGYNKNIGEGMYIEEMQAFIAGFVEGKHYPNSIADDIKVLKLLNAIENSDGGF